MPANSNRIIQSSILKETKTKPKQVLVHTDCFLACGGPVENFGKLL